MLRGRPLCPLPGITPCAGHYPTVLPQLHNKGPGTVNGVTLSLAVPHLLGDHVLLYLLELGTEGGMNCSHHPVLNPAQVGAAGPLPPAGAGTCQEDAYHPCVPFQLEIPRPTAAAPGNRSHQRERREAEPLPGAGLGDLVRVVSG